MLVVCSAKDKSLWLAPTRLALALAGGSSGQLQHEVTDGFIVVETNYRVRSMCVLYMGMDYIEVFRNDIVRKCLHCC